MSLRPPTLGPLKIENAYIGEDGNSDFSDMQFFLEDFPKFYDPYLWWVIT